MTTPGFDAESEFASVRVEIDSTGNGPRIHVIDRRTGQHRYLDPLIIEGLAWSSDEDLLTLVDPSKRWAVEPPTT